jgi:hypothetical protein
VVAVLARESPDLVTAFEVTQAHIARVEIGVAVCNFTARIAAGLSGWGCPSSSTSTSEQLRWYLIDILLRHAPPVVAPHPLAELHQALVRHVFIVVPASDAAKHGRGRGGKPVVPLPLPDRLPWLVPPDDRGWHLSNAPVKGAGPGSLLRHLEPLGLHGPEETAEVSGQH